MIAELSRRLREILADLGTLMTNLAELDSDIGESTDAASYSGTLHAKVKAANDRLGVTGDAADVNGSVHGKLNYERFRFEDIASAQLQRVIHMEYASAFAPVVGRLNTAAANTFYSMARARFFAPITGTYIIFGETRSVNDDDDSRDIKHQLRIDGGTPITVHTEVHTGFDSGATVTWFTKQTISAGWHTLELGLQTPTALDGAGQLGYITIKDIGLLHSPDSTV